MADKRYQSLGEAWNEFEEKILKPRNCPPAQVKEMKRGWWAGASAMMNMLTDTSDLPEDIACQKMDLYLAEIMNFIHMVNQGRA